MKPANPSHKYQSGLFNATILSAYLYVFMEWVFFATKPSSVSNLPWFETLKMLILTGGAMALFPLAGAFLFLLFSRIIKRTIWHERTVQAGYIIPAFVISVTALIMIDNFTYTVFKAGVISSKGTIRLAYAAGLILFFLWTIRSMAGNKWIRKRRASLLALGLMAVSITGFTMIFFSDSPDLRNPYTGTVKGEYPNIIILGADGLSAKYLSAYGYRFKTTPFLNELGDQALFAENAFPNASSTTASTASMLTGRESTEVQVFRYPDILSGRRSFEHLPGILKRHGYLTVQIGAPYYVDAGRLNLLGGFDRTHNQTIDLPALDVFLPMLGNSPSMYFVRTIVERAYERLAHIFLNRPMMDAVTAVHDPAARISDEARVDLILDTLDRADRPVFIFTHMMDTHGPEFASGEYVFSTGPSSEKWDVNNYLDAILTFDGNVKRIYDYLDQTGKLEDTILVIYTDHGFNYAINARIPILIRLPHDEHARHIKSNVQVIDVPATLLDYLGIPQPEWMSGTSLLIDDPPAGRIIFSTTSGDPREFAPPFHQINILQGIVCNRWYRLHVRENIYNTGRIAAHTAGCDEASLPEDEEIHRVLLDYLDQHGYDTQSLR